MKHHLKPRRRLRRGLLLFPLLGLLWLGVVAAPASAAGSTSYRDCSRIALAPNADLHRCDVSDETIIGLDLHGIYLSWSDLSRINGGCDPDQPRTNLAGARIARAILVDAKLCDAILSDADLHGSDMSRVSLEDASLFRANLSWAILNGAHAGFAPFTDANLSNVIWRNGDAIGASFNGADLHGIDFRGTNLRSARFLGSDLRYAKLGGVDFTNTDLTGANWRRSTGLASAIFSNTTCPDGTNSDANGGTCAGH